MACCETREGHYPNQPGHLLTQASLAAQTQGAHDPRELGTLPGPQAENGRRGPNQVASHVQVLPGKALDTKQPHSSSWANPRVLVEAELAQETAPKGPGTPHICAAAAAPALLDTTVSRAQQVGSKRGALLRQLGSELL